jgi:hypothetical protein
MALAATGKYIARFQVRGLSNRVANFTAKGSFASYGDAATAFGTLVTAFNAVCDGVIYGAQIVEEWADPAVSYGTISVSERGVLRGLVNGTTKPVTLQWPAPAVAIRQGSSGEDYNELDISAAAISTFWAQFAAAGWEISDGEHVSVSPGIRGGRVIASGSVP